MRWPRLGAVCVLFFARPAGAFTLESPFTDGCHEKVTGAALRTVRNEGLAPAVAYTRDERALAEDVPFHIPAGSDDLAGVTLVLGARENDLHGLGARDMENLSQLHGDDAFQQEHCLRTSWHDGQQGSMDALAACRAYVLDRLTAALDGLDAQSVPDPSKRAKLNVTLVMRGKVEVELPLFYLRMGEALHAVQDGFTHSFRTSDGHRVTTVLNWVEYYERSRDEARDGPPHIGALDECGDDDAIRRDRRTWATTASTSLLRAALNPSLDRAGKLAAFGQIFDDWFAFQPGCTAANSWCDAPENALRDEGCGCHTARGGGPVGVLLGAAGVAMLLRRRRRRALLGASIGLGATLLPRAASAHESHASESAAQQPLGSRFGASLAIGASIDDPAVNGSVGGRFRLADTWLVGIDAEWNPWISIVGTVRPGAFNAYGSLIKRWTLRSDAYALRSTVRAGTSTLLFDLYGAPRWSTGVYGGISFLGLETKIARGITLVFDPAEFAFVAPDLRGFFAYTQYRFTIGVQWGASGAL